LTGLTANTGYTYKAFAVVGSDTTYGTEITFTTDTIAIVQGSVTTQEAGDVANNTATLNGTVVSTGNATSGIVIGFVLSTQADPDLTTAGVTNCNVTYTSGMSTYTYAATGLHAGTVYFYRAYMTNAAGTVYGETKTFTTTGGINDVNEGGYSVSLYPNPTEGDATLRVEGLTDNARVIMTDVQGRVISNQEMAAGQKTLTISRNNLASGVYYIRVITNNTTRTEKLIIK
jgi:hypothetical protein